MRVLCEVEDADLENEAGYVVEGVTATCTRCQHETESYGRTEASIRRCLAVMREECPYKEQNFYVDSDDE